MSDIVDDLAPSCGCDVCALKVSEWKTRAERAEAVCAEAQSEGIRMVKAVMQERDALAKSERALQSDAGKGWVSPEAHREALEALREECFETWAACAGSEGLGLKDVDLTPYLRGGK